MIDKLDAFKQCLMKFEIAVLNQKPNQINLFNGLIEMFQANVSNDWISVDDDLPEQFEKVLLFCERYTGGYFQEIGYYNPAFASEYDKKESFSIKAYVTHWQLLPKDPEEY